MPLQQSPFVPKRPDWYFQPPAAAPVAPPPQAPPELPPWEPDPQIPYGDDMLDPNAPNGGPSYTPDYGTNTDPNYGALAGLPPRGPGSASQILSDMPWAPGEIRGGFYENGSPAGPDRVSPPTMEEQFGLNIPGGLGAQSVPAPMPGQGGNINSQFAPQAPPVDASQYIPSDGSWGNGAPPPGWAPPGQNMQNDPNYWVGNVPPVLPPPQQGPGGDNGVKPYPPGHPLYTGPFMENTGFSGPGPAQQGPGEQVRTNWDNVPQGPKVQDPRNWGNYNPGQQGDPYAGTDWAGTGGVKGLPGQPPPTPQPLQPSQPWGVGEIRNGQYQDGQSAASNGVLANNYSGQGALPQYSTPTVSNPSQSTPGGNNMSSISLAGVTAPKYGGYSSAVQQPTHAGGNPTPKAAEGFGDDTNAPSNKPKPGAFGPPQQGPGDEMMTNKPKPGGWGING